MSATFRLRPAVAGVLAVGLIGAAAATAAATGPGIGHGGNGNGADPGTGSATVSTAPSTPGGPSAAARTNTVTADRERVRQWEEFRLHGKVTGIKAGTAVRLQQMQHGSWKTLPAESVVNRSLDYSMRVKLGIRGVNRVRTVVAGQPSAPVTVTVR
ncbi:hypothetical protein SAMN05421870_1142 [Streptomyces qinglanensis]|uniref:Uncharacterized protein n=1 Tax=Streptomyces qinglanensis TaxID=943816 RepID=A0A1H9VYB7_9ACTN|nr:hypothetical protein SAMN05421870_1142 [Streptomyces qinglanensis]